MALKNGDLNIVLTAPVLASDEATKGNLHDVLAGLRTLTLLVFLRMNAFTARVPDYSIRCDSSIVSARSAVFRGLLNHVRGSGRIVLDETLLPRGFAPVVLHFLYTDELDFSMVSIPCAVACRTVQVLAIDVARFEYEQQVVLHFR